MPVVIRGSGTVEGISVGGLPDGIVDTDMLAANAVVTGKITDGTIVSGDIADSAITAPKIVGLGVTANHLASGVGGKLLQMVGSSLNTSTVIATTTESTTNLSQSITPSKTGSKLLFMCAGHYSQNHNGGSYGPQTLLQIYKQIGSGTDTKVHQVTYDYVANTDSVYHSHHFAATYFDSTATLNTTDAIKYTIYAKLLYASHQMRMNPSGYTSLVIQEYDA